MIRPDFWEILEDATTNRRFSVTLFTNGTRLNEEGVERLRTIRARMGSRFLVHISLDGGRPESHDYLRNRKGNFERVVRTMRMLHERGVHFYVESVLHERSATVEDVEAMCELVAPLGVTYISLHPGEMIGTGEGETTLFFTRDFLVDFGNRLEPVVAKWKERGLTISFSSYTFPLDEPTHDDKRARLREKDRLNGSQKAGASSEESENYGNPLGSFRSALMSTRSSGFNVCTAGISQAALGANGDVYGCPRYVGAKPYVKGNVRERTILDIWNAPGWDFLREDYQPKLKLCNDCAYFDNCFYGKTCRANPGYLFNDAYGVSPECILEYDRLELPYEKVKSYLEERIAENVGNDRIQRLCQRLLRDIAAKEARRQSATTTSVASTESAERAVT
jgi:radical SAM protein with 4Fe4S-binding SPASM domain